MLFQCERRALHERAADWSVRTHHNHMTGRGHDVMHMVRKIISGERNIYLFLKFWLFYLFPEITDAHSQNWEKERERKSGAEWNVNFDVIFVELPSCVIFFPVHGEKGIVFVVQFGTKPKDNRIKQKKTDNKHTGTSGFNCIPTQHTSSYKIDGKKKDFDKQTSELTLKWFFYLILLFSPFTLSIFLSFF